MKIELTEVIGLANVLAHVLEMQRSNFKYAKFDVAAMKTAMTMARPLIERMEEAALIPVARDGVTLSAAIDTP